tara:strand:+ start:2369 stop:3361 length:993 start_codon:yes stop_codon:yes gene_type:complete
MIFIGKAPYRISLLGGGSDLGWFVKDNSYGICFGYSLRKYSYSVINVLPHGALKGILDYSTREEYKYIDEIVHPIVREVLSKFNISNLIELKSFGFASGGSGLGGSASFILSLLTALSKAFELNLSDQEMIDLASQIEIERLKKPVGKQDQFLCSRSGFNSFTFYDDGSHKVNNISDTKLKVLKRLVNNFYLIPTNKVRKSEKILLSQKKDKISFEKIKEIRDIAKRFIDFDDERDFKIEELFNNSVKDSWSIKKNLSNVMTNALDEQFEVINKEIPNNWIRLLGAGSGGYFLVSSKIDSNEIIKKSDLNGIKGIFKSEISDEGISSFSL